MKTPEASAHDLTPRHRIGEVARQAGVPVTTLRAWELRHSAFAPDKTAGKQRLYSAADAFKAGLLKQLTDLGHGISGLAGLSAGELQTLLYAEQASALNNATDTLQGQRVRMAVVGLGLAGRIASQKFTLKFLGNALQVSDVFMDFQQAREATLSVRPELLLVKVNTLHASTREEIEALARKHGIDQTLVLYSYGPDAVAEALKRAGMTLRREPLSDYELADLISSVLLVDAAQSTAPGASALMAPAGVIPPRQYSDATLTRVASISTNVLCECPRHVAELITQLASFEQYSQECLNKHADDAHLHAYLRAVSGSARALFERALERVAEHEGISLKEGA
jgi:DNA-binding transcriptional MerR regulator